MSRTYLTASHDIFRSLIGYNYAYPIFTTYEYSNLCVNAENAGMRIVQVLDDGVVYTQIPTGPEDFTQHGYMQ